MGDFVHQMTPNQPADLIEPTEEEIRRKRREALFAVYEGMCDQYNVMAKYTRIDAHRVARTVEEYISERRALVYRDRIPSRIQRHKVAGLMASAILSNRPIRMANTNAFGRTRASMDNELFAIHHGLATCAEDCSEKQIKSLLQTRHFSSWENDFAFILRRGSRDNDSLIFIFKTLCLTYFPENLDHHSGTY